MIHMHFSSFFLQVKPFPRSMCTATATTPAGLHDVLHNLLIKKPVNENFAPTVNAKIHTVIQPSLSHSLEMIHYKTRPGNVSY